MKRVAVTLALVLAGCGAPAPSDNTTTAKVPGGAVEAAKPPATADSQTAADPNAVDKLNGSYVAISTTAMGVTGDLVIKRGRFTFYEGQELTLGTPYTIDASKVAHLSASWPSKKETPLTVWPVLAEHSGKGQRLCGAPVRFIAAGSVASDDPWPTLVLIAFNGDQPPGPTIREDAFCASYYYMSEADFEAMAEDNRAKLREARRR